MKRLFLFTVLFVLLASLVSASIVIEKDGLVVTIENLEDPEVREWFNEFMLDESYQLVRTEDDGTRVIADPKLEALHGQGVVAVSGLPSGRQVSGSHSAATQFLSSIVIFALVAVPLVVLGYEIARKR